MRVESALLLLVLAAAGGSGSGSEDEDARDQTAHAFFARPLAHPSTCAPLLPRPLARPAGAKLLTGG